MFRRHARQRQPAWQKWMNVALVPLRGQIEKVFGLMKRALSVPSCPLPGSRAQLAGRRVPELARSKPFSGRPRCQLFLLYSAINLRRADHLLA